MKNAVIIAEYNPFHNGHKYQIDMLKKLGAETVSVIINGDHTQNGQPMIARKHERAKMALKNGADLVFELPFRFGTSSAEYFARGAVDIAVSFSLFDTLCFGSESGNIDYFYQLFDIFSRSFSSGRLSELMSSGLSYPVALSNIFRENGSVFFPDSPNNILGFEYVKALMLSGSNIKPLTIKRSVSYDGNDIENNITSASVVRNYFYTKQDYSSLIPQECYSQILELDSVGAIADFNLFERVILSLIRQKKESYLATDNQLFNRINKFSNSESLAELYNSVKNKSCTMSSVKRAVLHYALGFDENVIPLSFLRVLAFNSNGRKLLADARKQSLVPIFHSLPTDKHLCAETKFDALSSDMYGLYCKKVLPAGSDYKTMSIYID